MKKSKKLINWSFTIFFIFLVIAGILFKLDEFFHAITAAVLATAFLFLTWIEHHNRVHKDEIYVTLRTICYILASTLILLGLTLIKTEHAFPLILSGLIIFWIVYVLKKMRA